MKITVAILFNDSISSRIYGIITDWGQ